MHLRHVADRRLLQPGSIYMMRSQGSGRGPYGALYSSIGAAGGNFIDCRLKCSCSIDACPQEKHLR